MKKSVLNVASKVEFNNFDEWRSAFIPSSSLPFGTEGSIEEINLVDELRAEMMRQSSLPKAKKNVQSSLPA